jgi:long-chain acyl-CoA synthetase
MTTASGLSDADLAARGMTLALHARRVPDEPALVIGDRTRTWASLNARANQLARLFRASGLGVGEAVALLGHNAFEFVETWAACMRAGLRLTPVNWHQSPDVVSYIVENCDAKALVASGRFAAAASLAGQSPHLVRRLAYGGAIEGFEDFDSALAEHEPVDLTDPEVGAYMLYTSGTTGRPKGVYRPVRPTVSQLTNKILETADFRPGDKALVTGPLYHAAPLSLNLVTPLNAGVACILMDKWDAEETLRLIERHRVTHTHMVPTMFHRMLQLPEATRRRYDVSSVRWILHGAAPCPPHVKQAIIDWFGPVVFEYYSSTEGGGVFIDTRDWLRKPGSVGRPVEGVAIKLLDADGNEVGPNELGTVYIKAPATGRFSYYKDPAKTASSYRGDHYTLGDMGYLDAEGFLFLTGRSAELIISGGVNIYPVEIDEALIQHEAVADAAAVGVPNEDWGEEIKAVVELKPGYAANEATRESILAFARDRLPGFQRPRTVDFVDALPRSAAGKVLRQQVRDGYWKNRKSRI